MAIKTWRLVVDDAVLADSLDLIVALEAKRDHQGFTVLTRINAQGMAPLALRARLLADKPAAGGKSYTIFMGDDVPHLYVFCSPDGHGERSLWACKLFVTDGILTADANHVVTSLPRTATGGNAAPWGAVSRIQYNAQSGAGRSTSQLYRQALQKMLDWEESALGYRVKVVFDDHLAFWAGSSDWYIQMGNRVEAQIPPVLLEDREEAPTTAADGTDGVWSEWQNPLLLGITFSGGQEFRSSPGLYYAGLTSNWRANQPMAAIAAFFGSFQCDYEWDNNLALAATTCPGTHLSVYDWEGYFPWSVFFGGSTIGDASLAYSQNALYGYAVYFITDLLGGDCAMGMTDPLLAIADMKADVAAIKAATPIVTAADLAAIYGRLAKLESGTLPTSPPAPAHATSLAVNCGGGAVADLLADQFYVGGLVWLSTGPVDISKAGNRFPAEAFASLRYTNGGQLYNLSGLTPNASYTLSFALFEGGWNRPGVRIQDIYANGRAVVQNCDVFAETGGWFRGLVKQAVAPADALGQIAIKVVASPGSGDPNAYICAIAADLI